MEMSCCATSHSHKKEVQRLIRILNSLKDNRYRHSSTILGMESRTGATYKPVASTGVIAKHAQLCAFFRFCIVIEATPIR